MSQHAVLGLDRRLLRRIYEAAGSPAVRLELWNGISCGRVAGEAAGSIVIRSPRALGRMLVDGETGFGEGYLRGEVEVRGDLPAVLGAVYRSQRDRGSDWTGRTISGILSLLQSNGIFGSRRNIHHHYDIQTEFFRYWLDRELVYTCAYFESPEAGLERAQEAKMEYICRKIRLQAGERVVEAGCGWGALALYMARRYFARVRAFNISHEQIVHARERAAREGLSERVEFIEDDYRNVAGRFDAFVSAGMLEHVGREHYADLGGVIHRTVGEEGRGLLHFIGRSRPAPLSRWIRARIFPGAYAPSLAEAVRIFEPFDYAVVDVENLRLHYAATLEHWLRRFERSGEVMAQNYGVEFLRAWRLYLAGSLSAFRDGDLQLFQVVFVGREWRGLAATREGLYGKMGVLARG